MFLETEDVYFERKYSFLRLIKFTVGRRRRTGDTQRAFVSISIAFCSEFPLNVALYEW